MKVHEYIEKLKQLEDQDAEVMISDNEYGVLFADDPQQWKGSELYRPVDGNVVIIYPSN